MDFFEPGGGREDGQFDFADGSLEYPTDDSTLEIG
jgi:hypothetical protein